MVGIETRRGDPGAGLTRNRGNVEDVVEMPVGDDDAANGLSLPAAPAKSAAQEQAPADESGIEQIQAGCVAEDIEVDRGGADLEDVCGEGGVHA